MVDVSYTHIKKNIVMQLRRVERQNEVSPFSQTAAGTSRYFCRNSLTFISISHSSWLISLSSNGNRCQGTDVSDVRLHAVT